MRRLRLFSILLLIVALACGGWFAFRRHLASSDSGPVLHYDVAAKDASIHDDDQKLLEGITAEDKKDGDVTDSLVVENLSNFVGNHERVMTFAAFDSYNHVTKGTKTIHYTDYTPTRFSLSSPMMIRTGASDFTTDLKAEDCLDGDISRNISMTSDDLIYTDNAGSHKATFSVTNSAGEVTSFRASIDVYESSASFIPVELTDYLVYTPVGQALDPWSYLKSVEIGGITYSFQNTGDAAVDGTNGADTTADGSVSQNSTGGVTDLLNNAPVSAQTTANDELRNAVTIDTSSVDYNTPGSYEITYTCRVGEAEGYVRLIVLVEDENGNIGSAGSNSTDSDSGTDASAEENDDAQADTDAQEG